jgi:hypothetical protein
VKLIIVLRDFIERAYSQYKHERAEGRETVSFSEAVNAELGRLGVRAFGELPPASACGFGSPLHRQSYVTRGIYAPLIERWLSHSGEEQVIMIRAESLFSGSAETLARLWGFLDLEWNQASFEFPERNHGAGAGVCEEVYGFLRGIYEPFDKRLSDLIGWVVLQLMTVEAVVYGSGPTHRQAHAE